MLRARGTTLMSPLSPLAMNPPPFVLWDVSKLSLHAAAEDLRFDLALPCYGRPGSTAHPSVGRSTELEPS